MPVRPLVRAATRLLLVVVASFPAFLPASRALGQGVVAQRSFSLLGGPYDTGDDLPGLSARYRIQTSPHGAAEAELAVIRYTDGCAYALAVGTSSSCERHHPALHGSITYGPSLRLGRLRPYGQIGIGAFLTAAGDFTGIGIGAAGAALEVGAGWSVRAEFARRLNREGEGITSFLAGFEVRLRR